ncbi:MAG: hypothetical protein HUJ68_06050 [Clostridia bacterium]|nr:hypothetical protein [Clostridia bacterium]
MRYISEEENQRVLDEIANNGWDNYKPIFLNEDSNSELVVVKIKGTIEDYAKRNGYINAIEAMKIIEQTRCE